MGGKQSLGVGPGAVVIGYHSGIFARGNGMYGWAEGKYWLGAVRCV